MKDDIECEADVLEDEEAYGWDPPATGDTGIDNAIYSK